MSFGSERRRKTKENCRSSQSSQKLMFSTFHDCHFKGLLNAPFKGVMILSCCGMMRSGELHSLLLMNTACDENALDIDDYHPCEFCFL